MVVVSLALICSGLEILFFIHLFNFNKDYTLGALPDAILPVNPDLDRTLGIIWFMGPVVGSNTLKKNKPRKCSAAYQNMLFSILVLTNGVMRPLQLHKDSMHLKTNLHKA